MPQFIIPKTDINNLEFIIKEPAEVKHLANVLRVQAGEKIYLFDGEKKHYLAEVKQITKNTVSGSILKEILYKEKNYTLRVFASLIKYDRFELMLEKLTELGVDEIIPIVTQRASVKPPKGLKFERWEKIILAAVKQCNCYKIPKLNAVMDFTGAFSVVKPSGLNLIAFESESPANSLKINLHPYCLSLSAVNLFIGPEGGFTDKEIEFARKEGFKSFSLGQNILRAETAAVAASSIIMYELNE